MQLWIRSQEKRELIPINDAITVSMGCVFYVGTIIGSYKSNERALEVLDEIQNIIGCKRILCNNTIATCNDFEKLNSIVYEMPKE